jgi:hypothetical protein
MHWCASLKWRLAQTAQSGESGMDVPLHLPWPRQSSGKTQATMVTSGRSPSTSGNDAFQKPGCTRSSWICLALPPPAVSLTQSAPAGHATQDHFNWSSSELFKYSWPTLQSPVVVQSGFKHATKLTLDCCPSGHGSHAVLPSFAEYFPVEQLWQAQLVFIAAKRPALHSLHVASPS